MVLLTRFTPNLVPICGLSGIGERWRPDGAKLSLPPPHSRLNMQLVEYKLQGGV